MRSPITHDFTDGEAYIFRRALLKPSGYSTRGYVSVLRNLEKLGLVTITTSDKPASHNNPAYNVKVTQAGLEAWRNFGLIAAGREAECLPNPVHS